MRGGQHTYPSCREFDRERQAVEQPHDFGHRSAVNVANDEIRLLRAGAGGEEIDRFFLQRQRFDQQDLLARQVEPLATGDHEGRVGGPIEPAAEGDRGVLQDLLEVVQDHQTATAAGNGVAELHAGIILAERDGERRGDGEKDAVERTRLGEIAEVDTTGPFAKPRPTVATDEASLAGAA